MPFVMFLHYWKPWFSCGWKTNRKIKKPTGKLFLSMTKIPTGLAWQGNKNCLSCYRQEKYFCRYKSDKKIHFDKFGFYTPVIRSQQENLIFSTEKSIILSEIYSVKHTVKTKKIPVKSKLTEQCMLYPRKREFFCQE